MPLTAHQLRQPPTIEPIYRGQYFADVANNILLKIIEINIKYYLVYIPKVTKLFFKPLLILIIKLY